MGNRLLLSLCLIFGLAALAFGQQQPEWTGNAYRLDKDLGNAYALGVVDGIAFAVAIERLGPGSLPDFFDACMRGRTKGQIKAVIDKYLADHPERWHEAMGELVAKALVEACHW